MKSSSIALALAASALLLWVGPARSEQTLADQHPAFSASVVSFRDTSAVPSAEITIAIPPLELSFVKAAAGYHADLDFTVTVVDSHGEQVGGDAWRRSLDLKTYAETQGTEAAVRERKRFRVQRGKYRLHVRVIDVNAEHAAEVDLRLDVEGGAEAGKAGKGEPEVRMSDIEMGTLVDSVGPARRESIRPSINQTFGNPLPRLASYGEIYVDSGGPDSVELRVEVRDETGNRLEQGHMVLYPERGVAPFLLRPRLDRLGVGNYVLSVEARWGRRKAKREIPFEMDESRVAFNEHFPELLEMVALIATPGELDSLESCSAADREACWNRFWHRRVNDPDRRRNLAAREFFRRIRHANASYSTPASGPGWRTDMGRVYIRYGAPEQTEFHPQSGTEFATQVWYYSDPRRLVFVFIDRSGFGRYELVSQRGG